MNNLATYHFCTSEMQEKYDEMMLSSVRDTASFIYLESNACLLNPRLTQIFQNIIIFATSKDYSYRIDFDNVF